jgi:LAS superfamily LD-carboxypeptidase LdcB
MKQESHTRARVAFVPVGSLWSSTVEQKQAGQTDVQLAQDRHRAAMVSQYPPKSSADGVWWYLTLR